MFHNFWSTTVFADYKRFVSQSRCDLGFWNIYWNQQKTSNCHDDQTASVLVFSIHFGRVRALLLRYKLSHVFNLNLSFTSIGQFRIVRNALTIHLRVISLLLSRFQVESAGNFQWSMPCTAGSRSSVWTAELRRRHSPSPHTAPVKWISVKFTKYMCRLACGLTF